MLENVQISIHQRKIDKMYSEISELRKAISDTEQIVNNFQKSADKLFTARDNMHGLVSSASSYAGELKMASGIKRILNRIIDGAAFSDAMNGVNGSLSDSKNKISDYQNGIKELQKKIEMESSAIRTLQQKMMEEENNG